MVEEPHVLSGGQKGKTEREFELITLVFISQKGYA
jgi:hypothetical protein